MYYCLNELNDGHLGIVTLTCDSPQNTGVPSTTIRITIRGGFEKRVDKILIVHPGKGLTTCVQVPPLSKLNHVINMLSYRSCTHQSGLDAPMPDNLCGECTKQSLSLICRLSQFLETLAVGDHIEGWRRLALYSGDGSSDEGSSTSDYKKRERGRLEASSQHRETQGIIKTSHREEQNHPRPASWTRLRKSPNLLFIALKMR